MSFSDSFPSFAPYTNGVDSMGGLWPQFSGLNEQPEVNSELDHDHPPIKRHKNSSDHTHRTSQTNPPVNQPNGRIFFKTRLCVRFKMGQCRNGEDCNFAHGEEDLRKPPPNWQELVGGRTEDRRNNHSGSENWEDDDKIIHKMKLCKKFYNGEECPYGERCNFLHKEPPKFREGSGSVSGRFRDNSTRECSAISIGITGPPKVQQQPPRVPDQYDVQRMMSNVNGGGMDGLRGNSRPVYWKTRLCTKFETGQCPFGDTCHFAHGQADLLLPGGRPVDAEPMIVNSIAPKPVSTPANDPNPVKVEVGVTSTQEGQGNNKCLLKWKGTKKINRIYGDWIDDLPLILPNEVES